MLVGLKVGPGGNNRNQLTLLCMQPSAIWAEVSVVKNEHLWFCKQCALLPDHSACDTESVCVTRYFMIPVLCLIV